MKKFLPLILFSILVLAGYANAQVTVCEGNVSFTVTLTEQYTASPGIIRFKTVHDSFDGKIRVFLDKTKGWVTNTAGNYIEFLDTNGTLAIGINEIAFIGTRHQQQGKITLSIVGIGNFFGIPPGSSAIGITYVDIKGTLTKVPGSGGAIISITISGKMGGGEPDNFVFSASFSSKMLPLS